MFHKKPIVTQETLGERFCKVRLGNNWTLKQASGRTKIASRYLLALEKSFYDEIPGEVYIKNFIKIYCKTLGLNLKTCLLQYEREKHVIEQKKYRGFLHEIGNIKFIDIILKPSTIKTSFICLVAALVLSYIILNIYQTIAPPALEIYYPQDNLETAQLNITVQGRTNESAQVSINKQDALLKADGSFEETITLRKGLNLIIVTAAKKHGLTKKIIRHILVDSGIAKFTNQADFGE
ncbi:MAG: helix-turn-helix domain-containing protein [Patescibacteria group bacterium]